MEVVSVVDGGEVAWGGADCAEAGCGQGAGVLPVVTAQAPGTQAALLGTATGQLVMPATVTLPAVPGSKG